MADQDTAALIRSIYEAFNDRDLDRGAAAVARDARLVDVATGETNMGPEGYKQYMQKWLTAFPDAKIEITNLVVAGEWATVEFTGRGTNSGPLAGPAGEIPATGRRIEMKLCDVNRVRDGKVVENRGYYDAAGMMSQLGLMPG